MDGKKTKKARFRPGSPHKLTASLLPRTIPVSLLPVPTSTGNMSFKTL